MAKKSVKEHPNGVFPNINFQIVVLRLNPPIILRLFTSNTLSRDEMFKRGICQQKTDKIKSKLSALESGTLRVGSIGFKYRY